jgi:hypothetical protein
MAYLGIALLVILAGVLLVLWLVAKERGLEDEGRVPHDDDADEFGDGGGW